MKRFWQVLTGAMLVAVVAGSIAGLVVSSGEAATTVPAASPTPDQARAPEWLSSLAAKEAAIKGDASPASAQWGLMKMTEAAPLLGGVEDVPYEYVDRQMYIVVLKGRFVDEMAFRPSGAKPPTGWCVVDVVDPETKGVVGMTLWSDDLKMDSSKVQTLAPLEIVPATAVE